MHTQNASTPDIHSTKPHVSVAWSSKQESTCCSNAPYTPKHAIGTLLPMAAPETSYNSSTTWSALTCCFISWEKQAPVPSCGQSGSQIRTYEKMAGTGPALSPHHYTLTLPRASQPWPLLQTKTCLSIICSLHDCLYTALYVLQDKSSDLKKKKKKKI